MVTSNYGTEWDAGEAEWKDLSRQLFYWFFHGFVIVSLTIVQDPGVAYFAHSYINRGEFCNSRTSY